jgi:hypothetical protein
MSELRCKRIENDTGRRIKHELSNKEFAYTRAAGRVCSRCFEGAEGTRWVTETTDLVLVEQSNIANLRFVHDSFLALLDMGSSPAVAEALVNN